MFYNLIKKSKRLYKLLCKGRKKSLNEIEKFMYEVGDKLDWTSKEMDYFIYILKENWFKTVEDMMLLD